MADDKLTLYNLTNEVLVIDDVLDEAEGELTPELEVRKAEMDRLIAEKVDAVCGYVQSQQDLIELAQAQIDRLNEFIRTKTRRLSTLDHYVGLCTARLGKESLGGELFEIKRGRKSQRIEISSDKNIPAKFWRVPDVQPTVMKDELKKAIKQGVTIDGVAIVENPGELKYKLKTTQKKKIQAEEG